MNPNKLTITGLALVIAILGYFLAKPAEKQPAPEFDYFAVYAADVHYGSYDPEINYYVKIPNGVPLKDRVQTLADKLSILRFSRLPIKLVSIKDDQGKKTAIIDLREIKNSNNITWRSRYFQGTAGGTDTTISLKNSFMQSGYEGPWIDEVEFRYNGQLLSANKWDHIPGLCHDVDTF
jgi:hypothetical protein